MPRAASRRVVSLQFAHGGNTHLGTTTYVIDDHTRQRRQQLEVTKTLNDFELNQQQRLSRLTCGDINGKSALIGRGRGDRRQFTGAEILLPFGIGSVLQNGRVMFREWGWNYI